MIIDIQLLKSEFGATKTGLAPRPGCGIVFYSSLFTRFNLQEAGKPSWAL